MFTWYSVKEQGEISLNSDKFELERIKITNGLVDDDLANALRLTSLKAVPAVPVWVYGSLLKGCSAHHLIDTIAFTEFKPESKFVEGIALYRDENLPYPMAVPEEGASTYMERYLVSPMAIEALDKYESAPHLYQLKELPDKTGYYYCWNLGMKDKIPVTEDKKNASWLEYLGQATTSR